MAIRMRENQYWGVNAHLHSAFQSGGPQVQWGSFHTINALTFELNSILPPEYRAISENSIQIYPEEPNL